MCSYVKIYISNDDEAQFESGVQSAEDDVTDAASAMGLGCIGSACCSTGTYYDSDKNECVFGSSKTNRPSVSEGYANYMPSVSLLDLGENPNASIGCDSRMQRMHRFRSKGKPKLSSINWNEALFQLANILIVAFVKKLKNIVLFP